MNTEKKQYVAPELTVVTFKTERGYALSGALESLSFWETGDADQMEDYSEHSDWHESGGFWG